MTKNAAAQALARRRWDGLSGKERLAATLKAREARTEQWSKMTNEERTEATQAARDAKVPKKRRAKK